MTGTRPTGVYTIGVVKKLTGLSERQIRYYDEKGLIHPQRTQGNQRLYAPGDVERLNYIKRLLQRGMSIREVKEILDKRDRELRQAREAAGEEAYEEARLYFRRQASPRPATLSPPSPAAGKLRSVYPLANRDELLKALDEMKKEK